MTDLFPMEIQVSCYAGYKGEQTPQSITIGNRRVDVTEILDMWLAPDHRYFKFKGSDDGLYIIRHDSNQQLWQLTLFQAE